MDITPEIQAVIDATVDSAKAGLQAKNQELLDKNKKLMSPPATDVVKTEGDSRNPTHSRKISGYAIANPTGLLVLICRCLSLDIF